jgi:hypothetical protein
MIAALSDLCQLNSSSLNLRHTYQLLGAEFSGPSQVPQNVAHSISCDGTSIQSLIFHDAIGDL